LGVAENYASKGNHIITTKMEHHAVLHTCEYLEKKGFHVTYLDVDQDGLVNLQQLEAAITDKTILITIMFANNEIGTIQPITEIGAIARKIKLFSTQMQYRLLHMSNRRRAMHIDLMSFSGHKIYGPKGIGALYIRKTVKLKAMIHGGAQERRRRGGTENVPGIVGFGKAVEIAMEQIEAEAATID
jgi:cysteine desulfurase